MEYFFQIKAGIKFMEALACLTGFVVFTRLRPSYWKAFPWYLLVITLCEFTGWYLNSHEIKGGKYLYSYFVIPLEFLFMHYFYFHIIGPSKKKLIAVLAILFILIFITEQSLLQHKKWVWNSLTYMTGSLNMLLLSVLYLVQLVTRDKVVGFTREPFFWVNLGLLLFYVGTFPYYATIHYLYKINMPLVNLLAWMMVILNYIMYSLFITGFLCFRKPQVS